MCKAPNCWRIGSSNFAHSQRALSFTRRSPISTFNSCSEKCSDNGAMFECCKERREIGGEFGNLRRSFALALLLPQTVIESCPIPCPVWRILWLFLVCWLC